MDSSKTAKFTTAFVVITSLFFMWGFITCLNDILIPYLKNVFELTRFKSMMVQFAFFTAYFIGSLIYFIVSSTSGDPILKIGYKRGIVLGLITSAAGCVVFYPAAEFRVYGLFLTALFILGLGFTLLQIAANPYVAILGKPETASSRLNLSQGFNSFGTTIAPIIGGYLIFHYFAKMGEPLLNSYGKPITNNSGDVISALGVQLPYLIFAGVFILLVVLIILTKLPKFNEGEHIEKGLGAFKYRHLVLGMIAIFMYVGAEVSIGSSFINYLNESLGYTEMLAKSFLAFYWGGAMTGRFIGAVSLGSMKNKLLKYIIMLGIGISAFFLIYSIVYVESGAGFSLNSVLPFIIIVAVNFIAFVIGRSLPHRTLMIFAVISASLCITAMLTNGVYSMWSLIAIGIFNSIMWSNIFTLAIKDLGKYTSQGSSLLVMMILGGAILPLLQGAIADEFNGYHYSFFIPALAYIYLIYYGWKGYIPLKK
ncbi:MAG: L-fucose:H+ symporter permease [Marinilabiliales bacterium]